MNNLNFEPIILTQNLVKCPSVTPKDAGALNLIENQLTGNIPPEIGILTNLTGLFLSYNYILMKIF